MIHDEVITIIWSLIMLINVDVRVACPNLADGEGSHGPPVSFTVPDRREWEVRELQGQQKKTHLVQEPNSTSISMYLMYCFPLWVFDSVRGKT